MITFAVRLSSYRQKLWEGSKKKTIKDFCVGVGGGRRMYEQIALKNWLVIGWGRNRNFCVWALQSGKAWEPQQIPEEERQMGFTRSCPVVPPYSSLMFNTSGIACPTGPWAGWITSPLPPLIADSQPGEQGYQQQPWGPLWRGSRYPQTAPLKYRGAVSWSDRGHSATLAN